LTWQVPRAGRLPRRAGRISSWTWWPWSSSTPAGWLRWRAGRKQARPAGPDLLLAAPRRQVLRILALTWLTGAFSVPASREAEVAGGSAGSCAPNRLGAVAGPDPAREGCLRYDGRSSHAGRVGRIPRPGSSWPAPAVRCQVAYRRNLVHRPSAARRLAGPGRVDISAAVNRSFERLGWGTEVRRPASARLDGCRRDGRPSGEVR